MSDPNTKQELMYMFCSFFGHEQTRFLNSVQTSAHGVIVTLKPLRASSWALIMLALANAPFPDEASGRRKNQLPLSIRIYCFVSCENI